MGNITSNPKPPMKMMPMGGIQDANGDYLTESAVMLRVNSHAALLEALELVANLHPDAIDAATRVEIITRARAAITKAKAKPEGPNWTDIRAQGYEK